MIGERGIHGPLEDMLQHLLRGTLANLSDDERSAILRDRTSWLTSIDGLVPLQFPRIGYFDDWLYPKT